MDANFYGVIHSAWPVVRLNSVEMTSSPKDHLDFGAAFSTPVLEVPRIPTDSTERRHAN